MHSKASLALGAGMMAIAAWAVIGAQSWPWKAALFPLVIGVPVFCLAAAEVLWTIFGKTERSDAPDFQLSRDLPAATMLRRTLSAIAWILGLFLGIISLGFLIAVPLFAFLYLTLQGRERWGLSLIYAFAVWAFLYGLFDRLLHLPFPRGVVQAWIGLG